jgi:hypothetical protein
LYITAKTTCIFTTHKSELKLGESLFPLVCSQQGFTASGVRGHVERATGNGGAQKPFTHAASCSSLACVLLKVLMYRKDSAT